MAAIFDFYRLGKAGKEICTKGVSDDQKKEMSEGGVINISFSPLSHPLPPPSTPAPNQIWRMEWTIANLMMLTRSNMILVLQATFFSVFMGIDE